ncbi:MAG: DUF167 domain-containing protein [Candidatus Nanohaloarchaea archaeon]
MAEIYVRVETGQEEFGIEFRDFPTFRLENEAENGRANAELIRRLEEILGEKPGIVSGHRSRRKKIRVDMPEDEMMERLENHG